MSEEIENNEQEEQLSTNTKCTHCGAILSPEESAYCEECAQWQ
jgi:uncharacterized OB-fold protein